MATWYSVYDGGSVSRQEVGRPSSLHPNHLFTAPSVPPSVELVGKKEGAALKRQQVTQPVPSGHSFKHNNEVKISTVRRRARTKSLKVGVVSGQS